MTKWNNKLERKFHAEAVKDAKKDHRRMLADYQANFDWKQGLVGPSYIAAAMRER